MIACILLGRACCMPRTNSLVGGSCNMSLFDKYRGCCCCCVQFALSLSLSTCLLLNIQPCLPFVCVACVDCNTYATSVLIACGLALLLSFLELLVMVYNTVLSRLSFDEFILYLITKL